MSHFWRAAGRTSAPLVAAFLSSSEGTNNKNHHHHPLSSFLTVSSSRCETVDPNNVTESSDHQQYNMQFSEKNKQGMNRDGDDDDDDEPAGDFHNLFPRRQLWKPALPYPLWMQNWDGREPPSTGDREQDREQMRRIRKQGVTRHIILVRHGQYDETEKEDALRILTPLGREQAAITGQRLAEMLKGAQQDFGPCNITQLRVSNMTRAKETADIIASYLPTVPYNEPDPQLNEGRPCHHIPGTRASRKIIELTDENHPRIEAAFRKYFYREHFNLQLDPEQPDKNTSDQHQEEEKHEFEVIICHANVIRYFLCRALQLPPEAWLRLCPFNCSLTYITIRATGSVSCRMMGDIGHLGYDKATFSKHHGFNW